MNLRMILHQRLSTSGSWHIMLEVDWILASQRTPGRYLNTQGRVRLTQRSELTDEANVMLGELWESPYPCYEQGRPWGGIYPKKTRPTRSFEAALGPIWAIGFKVHGGNILQPWSVLATNSRLWERKRILLTIQKLWSLAKSTLCRFGDYGSISWLFGRVFRICIIDPQNNVLLKWSEFIDKNEPVCMSHRDNYSYNVSWKTHSVRVWHVMIYEISNVTVNSSPISFSWGCIRGDLKKYPLAMPIIDFLTPSHSGLGQWSSMVTVTFFKHGKRWRSARISSKRHQSFSVSGVKEW